MKFRIFSLVLNLALLAVFKRVKLCDVDLLLTFGIFRLSFSRRSRFIELNCVVGRTSRESQNGNYTESTKQMTRHLFKVIMINSHSNIYVVSQTRLRVVES